MQQCARFFSRFFLNLRNYTVVNIRVGYFKILKMTAEKSTLLEENKFSQLLSIKATIYTMHCTWRKNRAAKKINFRKNVNTLFHIPAKYKKNNILQF
jgi:hypothetical protein